MEKLVELDFAGLIEVLKEDPLQCHFVHHTN
jgi:hypothetical protein